MKLAQPWSQIVAFSAACSPELTPASASIQQLGVSGLPGVCFHVPPSTWLQARPQEGRPKAARGWLLKLLREHRRSLQKSAESTSDALCDRFMMLCVIVFPEESMGCSN